jgi:hypothetical protein
MKDYKMEASRNWYLKDKLPGHWSRLDFQPRDLLCLRVLLEQKFLSHEQIVNFIFDGKKRYAYLRLWKLRRFGFIKRTLGFIPTGLYLPTEQTFDYFKQRFIELPMPVACPDPRTIFHDLLVTDIRFLFQKIGFGASWKSERIWRMGRSVRLWAPDAAIQVGGDLFAVEVERVQKEDVRYEDIFARYRENAEVSACLYITTDNLIASLIEKAHAYPNVYFTTLTELFEKKEKARFRNSQGNVLEIEENLERNLDAGSPKEKGG